MNSEAFSCSISTGINFEKFKDIKVKVRGREPPKHVEAISDTGLNDIIVRNVANAGYKIMTPIQKYTVPIILAKRDLVGAAQTGSGKTAAFLLPIIHQMSSNRTQKGAHGATHCPTCLIITPTRELALQIHAEANRFSAGLNLKCCLAYGGKKKFSMDQQLSDMIGGCDILVATPGRLLDYIAQGAVSLRVIEYAVVDEADRMLDMGFLPDVKRILHNPMIPPVGSKQTVMFSATFPPAIQEIATQFLNDYLFVGVGMVGGACTDVEQTFYCMDDEASKFSKVVDILRTSISENEKTMVFLRTKARTKRLSKKLEAVGFNCSSIHGDKSQGKREEALLDFRTGRSSVLMCTNVVARGLDIPNVGHVINYDLPQYIDEYIHRIGRTGRVGNIGRATAFYIRNANIEVAADLVTILGKAGQVVPDWLMQEASLRVTHKDIKRMRLVAHKDKIPPLLHVPNGIAGPGQVATSVPPPQHQPPAAVSHQIVATNSLPVQQQPSVVPSAAAAHPMWDTKVSKSLIHDISQKTKMPLNFSYKRLKGETFACHVTLGAYSVSVEGISKKAATTQACDQLMKTLPENILTVLRKSKSRH